MQGGMSLAVITGAVRSTPQVRFRNGCTRWLWLTGASACRSTTNPREEFLKNQERLDKNRTNGEKTLLSGPARDTARPTVVRPQWPGTHRALHRQQRYL